MSLEPSSTNALKRYSPVEGVVMAVLPLIPSVIFFKYLGEYEWTKVVLAFPLCYVAWRVVLLAVPEDYRMNPLIRRLFGWQAVVMVLFALGGTSSLIDVNNVIIYFLVLPAVSVPPFYLYSILPEDRQGPLGL